MAVRACADRDEFARAIYSGWQYNAPPPDDETVGRWLGWVGQHRMHAAFDDDEIVGGAGSFRFDLSVPGGSLPCAGVTAVGVAPTHRRRGILRAMMRAQLDALHDRGEPIAALWASEETIYGRFGYGIAAWCGEVTVQRDRGAFAHRLERRGRVRTVTPEAAAELFPPVWDALRGQRPGVFARSESWWRERVLRTPDEQKSTPKRLVALELDGTIQAYAVYTTASNFDGPVSQGKLDVVEAIGSTPQATAEIWRYLLDIDWMATIHAGLIPPDHPLFLLLAHPRRARFWRRDGLWVRLVDVGAALSGRAYATTGPVVLEVRDAFCPWNEGRWKLEGGTASRTDDAPELALEVGALGSAYLGAVSFAELHDALRVEELAPGAIGRADAAFGWRPLPWCPEFF